MFSEDLEEHEQRFKSIIERLKQNVLQVKLKKCEFLQSTIRFFGHVISHGKVEKSLHLVKAIASAEVPKTMTQLRSFMGLASYFRKFIKGFSKFAAPLKKHLNVTGKNVLLSEDAKEAFEKLKQELTNVLALPDFDLPFILETDASDNCIGAAQLQEIEGVKRTIAFLSRKMNDAERNYDTSQKELLAIVKAVEHFRLFLLRTKFKIRTDHAPLTSIKTNANPSRRLARWLDHLSMYTFEIEHKKGTDNLLTDALSRLNIPECRQDQDTTYVDQIINAVNIVLSAEGQEMKIHEQTDEENEGAIPHWPEAKPV